jgi:hypothetical protein
MYCSILQADKAALGEGEVSDVKRSRSIDGVGLMASAGRVRSRRPSVLGELPESSTAALTAMDDEQVCMLVSVYGPHRYGR